uniref:Uncharacterized protein n=1 Tax=Tanacetum cinerariifolium TaxID=118510 RepID=A0A6L2MKZ6_TANCI|nr:hypothetical protein [Tanacetum cinerariifolium]
MLMTYFKMKYKDSILTKLLRTLKIGLKTIYEALLEGTHLVVAEEDEENMDFNLDAYRRHKMLNTHPNFLFSMATRDIVEGLISLHNEGLSHGNVCPCNVVVLQTRALLHRLTIGRSQVDDIKCLGALLFHLFTCGSYFGQGSYIPTLELCNKHLWKTDLEANDKVKGLISCRDIVEGLISLHNEGLSHGNVCPCNVVLISPLTKSLASGSVFNKCSLQSSRVGMYEPYPKHEPRVNKWNKRAPKHLISSSRLSPVVSPWSNARVCNTIMLQGQTFPGDSPSLCSHINPSTMSL